MFKTWPNTTKARNLLRSCLFNFGGRKKTHQPWQALQLQGLHVNTLGFFGGWQGIQIHSNKTRILTCLFFTKNKGHLKSYSKKEGSFVIAFGQGCCFLSCCFFLKGYAKVQVFVSGQCQGSAQKNESGLVSVHFIWSVGEKLWKGGGAGYLGVLCNKK